MPASPAGRWRQRTSVVRKSCPVLRPLNKLYLCVRTLIWFRLAIRRSALYRCKALPTEAKFRGSQDQKKASSQTKDADWKVARAAHSTTEVGRLQQLIFVENG